MNVDEKNATKTPSVFTGEIRLSKSELEETIQRVVKVAIEEERENMLKAFEYKMNDVVEKRDRILTMQLHQSFEDKRLEIAAAKEEENVKPWWKKLFK